MRIFIIFINLLCFRSQANETSDQAIAMLAKQKFLLTRLEVSVSRLELARLHVFKKTIDKTVALIEENVRQGRFPFVGHANRSIESLLIQYQFSHAFFGWEEVPQVTSIYSDYMSKELEMLKESYDQLAQAFGQDIVPYTTITESYFRQIHRVLNDLEKTVSDDEVRETLRSLWPSVGHAISLGYNGDRPCTFAKASLVIQEIRSHYELLNNLSQMSASYSQILELQGLAEFYAEFAQVDRQSDISECD